MRNSRSPLIENTQSVNATSRRPVRRDVWSLTSPSMTTSTRTSVSGWLAERVRPPQARRGDVERPLDVVDAGGQGVLGLADDVAVGGRADADGVGGEGVEAGVEAQVGTRLVGVAAQHAQAIDAHGAGVVDAHGAPQTAGVPVAVDGLGVLQHARDVAPPRRAALGRARHLHRQHVLVRHRRQLGDVEAVREEVALRVTEVGAVEPGVGLVEDPVERHPASRPRRRGSLLEAASVEHRAVAGGELGMGPPVPGDVELGPPRVVDIEGGAGAAELVVGLPGTPGASEIHDG